MLTDLLNERDERAHGEDGGSAGVLELVEDLAFLVEGVEGGDDAAGKEGGVEGDEILGGVARENGDAIAFLDAVVLEEAAELAAGGPGLAEGVLVPSWVMRAGLSRYISADGARRSWRVTSG